MSHDNEILSDFTENVLNSEKYIRWVGITDQNGIIINEKHREELKLLLNNEENQESAVNTITRHNIAKLLFEKKQKLDQLLENPQNNKVNRFEFKKWWKVINTEHFFVFWLLGFLMIVFLSVLSFSLVHNSAVCKK